MSDVDLDFELKRRTKLLIITIEREIAGLKSYDLAEIMDRYVHVCRLIVGNSELENLTEEEIKIATEIYKTQSALIDTELDPAKLVKYLGSALNYLGKPKRQDVICVLNILPSYIKHEQARDQLISRSSP